MTKNSQKRGTVFSALEVTHGISHELQTQKMLNKEEKLTYLVVAIYYKTWDTWV